jgi:hypothetical protein
LVLSPEYDTGVSRHHDGGIGDNLTNPVARAALTVTGRRQPLTSENQKRILDIASRKVG